MRYRKCDLEYMHDSVNNVNWCVFYLFFLPESLSSLREKNQLLFEVDQITEPTVLYRQQPLEKINSIFFSNEYTYKKNIYLIPLKEIESNQSSRFMRLRVSVTPTPTLLVPYSLHVYISISNFLSL